MSDIEPSSLRLAESTRTDQLDQSFVERIDEILDATEVFRQQYPDHQDLRRIINSDISQFTAVEEVLTTEDAAIILSLSAKSPLAKLALIDVWKRPEDREEIKEKASLAIQELRDLKSQVPKKEDPESVKEYREKETKRKAEVEGEWLNISQEKFNAVQQAAMNSLAVTQKIAVNVGFAEDPTVENARQTLIEGVKSKNGVNLDKCHLTPGELLQMWEEVRDETSVEKTYRVFIDLISDPVTKFQVLSAVTMAMVTFVAGPNTSIQNESANSHGDSNASSQTINNTVQQAEASSTEAQSASPTVSQDPSAIASTPTQNSTKAPVGHAESQSPLPTSVVSKSPGSSSATTTNSHNTHAIKAPEAEPTTTTTTTAPTPPATQPITPVSEAFVNTSEGYVIPIENAPSGYDRWNISSTVNEVSGFSGADYDQMVEGTALEGVGNAIYQIEQRKQVNGLFILAHMAEESAWGTSYFARTRYNFWGLGAYTDNPDHAFYFESVEDCLEYYTNLIVTDYITPGGKYFAGTSLHDIFINYSTSDSKANELAGVAEDQTIVGIINKFLNIAQSKGLQPTGASPAPTPPTTITTTTTTTTTVPESTNPLPTARHRAHPTGQHRDFRPGR